MLFRYLSHLCNNFSKVAVLTENDTNIELSRARQMNDIKSQADVDAFLMGRSNVFDAAVGGFNRFGVIPNRSRRDDDVLPLQSEHAIGPVATPHRSNFNAWYASIKPDKRRLPIVSRANEMMELHWVVIWMVMPERILGMSV